MRRASRRPIVVKPHPLQAVLLLLEAEAVSIATYSRLRIIQAKVSHAADLETVCFSLNGLELFPALMHMVEQSVKSCTGMLAELKRSSDVVAEEAILETDTTVDAEKDDDDNDDEAENGDGRESVGACKSRNRTFDVIFELEGTLSLLRSLTDVQQTLNRYR